MKKIALFLEPLDPLFFRDGRPFGAATRLKSVLPTPQTLMGAVRSYLLRQNHCDFDALSEALRTQKFKQALAAQSLDSIADVACAGPWLSRCKTPGDNTVDTVYVEPPAALKQVKGIAETYEILRPVSPSALPGWSGNLWPLWSYSKSNLERVPTLMSLSGLEQFLAGKKPDHRSFIKRSDLYQHEERTGIGLNRESQSTEEGLIYSIESLRLREGVGFYCELEIPDSLCGFFEKTIVLRFGGESRRVLAHPVSAVRWPEPDKKQGDFQVMYMLSDMPVDQPDWHTHLNTLSIAQEPYRAISGWDMAKRGPKPTRYTLPAGSVLYFKKD